MPVRKLNPTSAGRRFQTVSTFEEITRSGFERALVGGMPERADAAITFIGRIRTPFATRADCPHRGRCGRWRR